MGGGEWGEEMQMEKEKLKLEVGLAGIETYKHSNRSFKKKRRRRRKKKKKFFFFFSHSRAVEIVTW